MEQSSNLLEEQEISVSQGQMINTMKMFLGPNLFYSLLDTLGEYRRLLLTLKWKRMIDH